MNNFILDKLKWRYATKKFDASKEVSKEKIALLKEAFNLTATSYGLQPLKLIIISNKEIQNKLVEASMNQIQVKDASHVLVICIENKIDKHYIENYFNRVQQIRGTSDEIINPFKEYLIQSFAEKTSQEVKSWMINQAYIALGNLLTVCALESIDACPMEGFIPNEYDNILNLSKKGLSAVLVLPIGYRASDDFFANLKKVRKGVPNVVIEID
jgi:nitroreductase